MKEYLLNLDVETTIGRSKRNDIIIEDGIVSSKHAVIIYTKDGAIINDVHSSNGTKVNGNKIVSYQLNDMDKITLGNTDIIYCDGKIVVDNSMAKIANKKVNYQIRKENTFRISDNIKNPQQQILIGRSRSNKIILSDSQVSHSHAKIGLKNSSYYLYDNNSSNGSYVNGNKVTSHKLVDDDEIVIGNHKITYVGGMLFSDNMKINFAIESNAVALKSKKRKAKVEPLIRISKNKFTIGRAPSCDFSLPDKYVSKVHAVIDRQNNSYTISDNNSTKGLFVNDQRISKAKLNNNDAVKVGHTVVYFSNGAFYKTPISQEETNNIIPKNPRMFKPFEWTQKRIITAGSIAVACLIVLMLSILAFNVSSKPKKIDLHKVDSVDGIIMASKNNVVLDLSLINGVDESDVSLHKIKPDMPKGVNADLNAYDFKVDGHTNFDVPIQLRIPFNMEKIDSGQYVGDCVSAGYYNESTQSWEPVFYTLDEENQEVIITTDHLSIYSAITYKNSNTRKATAFIDDSIFYYRTDADKYGVFDELVQNNGNPGEEALKFGISALGTVGNTGNVTGTYSDIANACNNPSWDAFKPGLDTLKGTSDAFNKLNTTIGNIGKAASLMQIGSDIYNGNTKAANIGAMKFTSGQLLSTFAPLAGLGVFAIEYSLNELAVTLIQGRKDLYVAALDKYYNEKYHNNISEHLYHGIYGIYDKYALGEVDDLNQAIDKYVKDFCNEFWAPDVIHEVYLGEVKKYALAGSTAGLTDEMKQDISGIYYNSLREGRLPVVLDFIANEISDEQFDYYYEQVEALTDYFNQSVRFTVYEERLSEDLPYKYANHIVKFITNNEDAKGWTGKLNANAKVSDTFTMLGYLQAGEPLMLSVYSPDSDLKVDDPIKTVGFNMKVGQPLDIALCGYTEFVTLTCDSNSVFMGEPVSFMVEPNMDEYRYEWSIVGFSSSLETHYFELVGRHIVEVAVYNQSNELLGEDSCTITVNELVVEAPPTPEPTPQPTSEPTPVPTPDNGGVCSRCGGTGIDPDGIGGMPCLACTNIPD